MTKYSKFCYSYLRTIMMKTWIILGTLLVLSLQQLRPCRWVQIEENNQHPLYYLREPSFGSCQYSTNANNGPKGSAFEATFVIKNLDSFGQRILVISCLSLQVEGPSDCQALSSLNLLSQESRNIHVKAFSTFTKVTFSFQNLNRVEDIGQKKKGQKKIQIQWLQFLKMKTDFKENVFQFESLWFIIICLFNFGLLRLSLIEPLLQSFSWIQTTSLLKIVIVSLKLIFNIDPQITNGLWQYKAMAFVAVYVGNFIIIGLCLKFILNYLQFGAIRFKKQMDPSLSVDQLQFPRPELSRKKFYEFINLPKIINFYRSQNQVLKRVIQIAFLVAFLLVMETKYPVINTIFESICFVLLPVYVQLKNVKKSTELQFQILCPEVEEGKIRREAVLFPKIKIHVFFVTCMEGLVLSSGLYDSDRFRVFLQFGIAFGLWMTLLSVLSFVVRSKLGIRVKMFVKNTNEGNCDQKKFKFSSLFQFLHQRSSETFQNQSQSQDKEQHSDCSICLQELDNKKCIQTQCGHVFHAKCFSIWVKNKMICPIDRNALNEETVISVLSESNV